MSTGSNHAQSSAPTDGLQAWIDVGGTFTDCFVTSKEQRRAGQRSRLKILSSGLVPVSRRFDAGRGRDVSQSFWAPELSDDAARFWRGATLRMFNQHQQMLGELQVVEFDADHSRLELAGKVPELASSFELNSGLEAPVLAVRRLLGCALDQPLPRMSVRLGTTRGTNALLTRRGAQVALAITASLEDLMLIGDQTRPRLFDLGIQRDEQLMALTIGIEQRQDATGRVLVPLNESSAKRDLLAAREAGCDSLAICLLHSYRNPEHELRLETLAREVGFRNISRSSGIAPLIEIVARARTTIVDAYLGPIIRSYLSRLAEQFGDCSKVDLQIMTSAGGLVDWQAMAGKDSILSGPAGGVVALRQLARATGHPLIIGLDMGGTSTDACRTAPDQTLEYESTKAGVRILTPTLPIETVASGGGSVCWFDGVALRVGPQSAGALPGPACYGRNGPLTITDLNVFLGRIPPEQFPFPLDLVATKNRLAELHRQLDSAGVAFASLEQLAEGLRVIANQQMAEAVRTITIAQGADPREHALVGFGGAAGQHICEIATLLNMHRIIDTPDAGLLSALGMGLAAERRDAAVPIYKLLEQVEFEELRRQANQVVAQLWELWPADVRAAADESFAGHAALELRYVGTDASLPVAWCNVQPSSAASALPTGESNMAVLAQRFHAEHQKRFGYARLGRKIEAVSLRVDLLRSSGTELPPLLWKSLEQSSAVPAERTCKLWFDAEWRDAAVVRRDQLGLGTSLQGPAVVLSSGSTLVIAPNWIARAAHDGSLLLERQLVDASHEGHAHNVVAKEDSGAVAEAVFAQRLAAIATQMGVVLQQTALSVNVKQRRDFSCAVFDSHGRMLASAPHVPVHLGAMGTTVRAAMRLFPDLQPGDVVVTNDPYSGGSHLPDVTVISGVYAPGQTVPQLFVANRAHHADIGGMAPGSMCVTADRLADEGVIITPLRLRATDLEDLEPIVELFRRSTWPPRNIDENLADLRAQIAANARGTELLRELADTFGWRAVATLTQSVLAMAEQKVRQYIRSLPDQTKSFVDHMDDGTPIAVSITPFRERLRIDFSGTGPTSRANFNANPSIVSAAIIYVLRCLIADDLPLNEGMLAAVDLEIPEGILNPCPAQKIGDSPAVAAGNVETSQRVVDVLLGALGAAAASQGTMNNLLFGNDKFGFYETICGGAGATAQLPGASGVHTHMTNTRLTDPEVLEARYPARLVHFGLRRGSGGAGANPGGDGVVRAIQFLEPVTVSLLTSRRGSYLPYGAAGGQPGKPGVNTRIDVAGQSSPLPSACFVPFQAGEIIQIETPGGGGFGPP